MIRPVIKWSGSKRSQAPRIASLAPKFETYYEPFVGGGSVMYELTPTDGICGDLCEPLVALWERIQQAPVEIADTYEKEWELLQREGPQHFYNVREMFNQTKSPEALLFLSRTCVNGLIRFNSKGDFNNSFHLSRRGIKPDTLRKIIADWSSRIQGVKFLAGDYRITANSAGKGDFVYLDPPYMNTVGRYQGTSTINFVELYYFLDDLNRRGAKWALSFDGKRGDREYASNVPTTLYKTKLTLESGQSASMRVLSKRVETVYESLYLNYEI